MSITEKKAFTLIECMLALMLFSVAAVMIAQTCHNTINTLDKLKKNSDLDILKDYIRTEIMNIETLDELEDGLDLDTFDNQTIRVEAQAFPTDILDLFQVEFKAINSDFEYSDTLLLIRESWYEDTSERDDLIEDRKDYLENARQKMSLEESKK